MSSHASGLSVSPLRGISNLLSTTTVRQLPYKIPHLVSALPNCAPVLSSPENHTTTQHSENAVATHKFKTQISTLLQHSSPEGRWAAVVLIKCAVEIGGWEILRGCASWVRGILGILGKPDPVATKMLCIITLSKIFVLTREFHTLVREINTPIIPLFISSCLNLIKAKGSPNGDDRPPNISTPLLQPILESFCLLLPNHPTLFRPFATPLQGLLLRLVAPALSTSSVTNEAGNLSGPHYVSNEVAHAARQLFASLHFFAPKNTADAEWLSALKGSVEEAHATADQLFRAVLEDWETMSGQPRPSLDQKTFGEQVSDLGQSSMGLPKWSGVEGGLERLSGLLNLIEQFVLRQTYSNVSFPVGLIMDLLARILALTVPGAETTRSRFNPAIGREERERLWIGLPQVHVAALGLLSATIDRSGYAFMPLVQGSLDQLCSLFETEYWDLGIRTCTYNVIAKLLNIGGLVLTKTSVTSMSRIIRFCCEDLLPTSSADSNPKDPERSKHGPASNPSTNADAFAATKTGNQTPSSLTAGKSELPLVSAATTLLPLLISNISTRHLNASLRDQVDRTAILIQHKEAMLASVLNQPPRKRGAKPSSSIMPYLARSFGGEIEVEGLLRPRMPVLRSQQFVENGIDETEERYHEAQRDSSEVNNGGGFMPGQASASRPWGESNNATRQKSAWPPSSPSATQPKATSNPSAPEKEPPSSESNERAHPFTTPPLPPPPESHTIIPPSETAKRAPFHDDFSSAAKRPRLDPRPSSGPKSPIIPGPASSNITTDSESFRRGVSPQPPTTIPSNHDRDTLPGGDRPPQDSIATSAALPPSVSAPEATTTLWKRPDAQPTAGYDVDDGDVDDENFEIPELVLASDTDEDEDEDEEEEDDDDDDDVER
ncbi:MAG: hypothetical protein M1837_000649 [Sclerophora amabilis]|nr:MAG: hypothetical protein M1837_000649 [Sclerophora amabilis]